MSKKAPAATKPSKRRPAGRKAKELALTQQAEQEAAELAKAEQAKVNSRITLSSYSSAALIAKEYSAMSSTDTMELQSQLKKQCLKVQDGDLGRAGSMLIAQAHSLDVIFTRLALDASLNLYSNVPMAETQLRMALKAQNQCRMTLETLAEIKNPPVVFAKQANIAHGHQQVNNGTAVAHAGETEKPRTELLGHDHGERLDTGTATAAGGSDSAVATVVEIHRATQRRRQGRIKP